MDHALDLNNDGNFQQNAVENFQTDFLFVACDGDQAGEQQQYEFEQYFHLIWFQLKPSYNYTLNFKKNYTSKYIEILFINTENFVTTFI